MKTDKDESEDLYQFHEKIIKSLHHAEAEHNKALGKFLDSLQARIKKINELNENIKKASDTARGFEARLIEYINVVNHSDKQLTIHNQNLGSWIAQAGSRLEFAARSGTEKITRKFKWFLIFNTILNIIVITLVLYKYYPFKT